MIIKPQRRLEEGRHSIECKCPGGAASGEERIGADCRQVTIVQYHTGHVGLSSWQASRSVGFSFWEDKCREYAVSVSISTQGSAARPPHWTEARIACSDAAALDGSSRHLGPIGALPPEAGAANRRTSTSSPHLKINDVYASITLESVEANAMQVASGALRHPLTLSRPLSACRRMVHDALRPAISSKLQARALVWLPRI